MINHLAIYLKCSIEALDASGEGLQQKSLPNADHSVNPALVAQGPSGEAPPVAVDPITDFRNSEGAQQ